MTENPKLAGSNVEDCIPQTGPCPNNCPECFYNRAFYRTLDEPLLPDPDEVNAAGRIVRVNSGNDSNLERDTVLAATEPYRHKFYNTSIPRFDFPAPVVFTCNGRGPLYVACPPNVMAVRIRCNTWDLDEQFGLAEHYIEQGVPVVMTFMRYYTREPEEAQRYFWRKHLVNDYWCPKPDAVVETMGDLIVRLGQAGLDRRTVRMCGKPWSSLCVECDNCETLYWACLRRMEKGGDDAGR